MKPLKYILSLIVCALMMFGCAKEDSSTTTITTVTQGKTDNVNFLIIVQDESETPISNARVSLSGVSDTYNTNEDGTILLRNLTLAKLGNLIEVSKSGFLPQYKLLSAREDSDNTLYLTLLKVGMESTITTGSVGAIHETGQLTLPSFLETSTGEQYSGDVIVESRYVNPDNLDFLNQAPGNMIGERNNGSLQGLRSLGMYSIELKDQSGNELSIPENEKAIIEFPVPDVISEFDMSTIPLWSFDESSGLWIEEGIADIFSDNIRAEVSHFSWWNCDLPFEFVDACIQLIDENGKPASFAEVKIGVGTSFFAHVTSDNRGYICGKFPLRLLLTLQLIDFNNEIIEFNFGPITTSGETIIVTVPKRVEFTGRAINCDAIPVENGVMKITYGSGTSRQSLVASDGTFSGYFGGQSLDLEILDLDAIKNVKRQVTVEDINNSEDLGDIVVCDGSTVQGISGRVMIDTDGDLIADLPLAGAQVALVADDVVYQGGLTNEDGEYSFATFTGAFGVTLVTSDYYVPYAGDKTPDDEDDEFQVVYSPSIKVELEEGELDEDNDFLVWPKGFGTLSGSIMYDLDGDGVGDRGAYKVPYYYGNPDDNSSIQFGYTDANGDILEENIANTSGVLSIYNYYASMITSSRDDTPDPDGAFDPDGEFLDRFRVQYAIHEGEHDADNNILLHSQFSNVTGGVFEDTDNDGVGDTPVPGQRVEIYARNENDVPMGDEIRDATTDNMGHFQFYGLQEGEYVIYFIGSGPEYEILKGEDEAVDNNPTNMSGEKFFISVDIVGKEWDDGIVYTLRKI